MVKRHVPILMSGLALGLVLMVFGSLALAQEQASPRDSEVRVSSPVGHVEGEEPIRLPAGQVVSQTVNIESVLLQITERITKEIQMPLTDYLLPEARLVERNHATQPIRREFRVLTGQVVVDEAYPITLSAPTHDSDSGDVRPAAVCTVNRTTDSGPGTLRQCLEDAGAGDTTTFDAAVFPPSSPVTISLSSPLPWIITDSLTIDASNAGVILDGSGLSSGTGFVVSGADGVKIRGLQIVHFPLDGVAIIGGATNTTIGGDRSTGSGPLGQGNLISGNGDDGIHIQGSDTTGNQVLGNFIGTNVSGTAALGNLDKGIVIISGASNNVIGGSNATPGVACSGECNLISGNKVDGILLADPDTTGNQVLGNFIGTNVAGTLALGNLRMGVFISKASNNIIGGNTPSVRNLISGNEAIGILFQDPGTTGNKVLGNYIGTDVSGTTALGNYQSGIVISFEASHNFIGGALPGEGNLISGNEYNGIQIQNLGTTYNQVLGNLIGTDRSGTEARGNLQTGVFIGFGASNNTVGDNLISGNKGAGIWLEGAGTVSNTVRGNFVGTDVDGTVALDNLDHGIIIYQGASNNIIGGSNATPGAACSSDCNLISGNEGSGIWLEGTGTTNNTVQGNFIGTDADGMTALGNLQPGITIGWGASNNIIGGATSSTRNLISSNQHAGIWLGETGTTDNQILGNFIGTNVDGTADLGNLLAGVFVGFGASNNLVGGETIQAGNTIAFNNGGGVCVDGSQTLGNIISHNSIYDNGGLGIENTNGGNIELAPPTITEVTSTTVSGQTGPGHIVEVFSDNDGEGRWLESIVMAGGDGVFTLTYLGVFSGLNLTTTATDADGNTSEFSTPFPVGQKIFLPIIIKSPDQIR